MNNSKKKNKDNEKKYTILDDQTLKESLKKLVNQNPKKREIKCFVRLSIDLNKFLVT